MNGDKWRSKNEDPGWNGRHHAPTRATLFTLIKESWRGERSLVVVFWGYYVGFSVVYVICLIALTDASPFPLDLILVIVGSLLLIPYGIWILVSIWRCANNSAFTWKLLARAWIVIFLIGNAGRFGTLWVENYQYYFDKSDQSEIERTE